MLQKYHLITLFQNQDTSGGSFFEEKHLLMSTSSYIVIDINNINNTVPKQDNNILP